MSFEVILKDGSKECGKTFDMTVNPGYDCMGNSSTLAGLIWTVDTSFSNSSGSGTHGEVTNASGASGGGTFNSSVPSVPGDSFASGVYTTKLCNPTASDRNFIATFTINTLVSNCTNLSPPIVTGSGIKCQMALITSSPFFSFTVMNYTDQLGIISQQLVCNFSVTAMSISTITLTANVSINHLLPQITEGTITLDFDFVLTES